MKNRRVVIVGSIIVTIVIMIILALMYYHKMQEMQETQEQLIEVNAQVEVLEADIAALEREKEKLWEKVEKSGESEGNLTISFVNMSEETYHNAVPIMEEYGYQGTIVWLESAPNLLEEWYILDLIEEGWDVVVGGSGDTEGSLETMLSMREELVERGITTSDMCYIENGSLDAKGQEILLNGGMSGYVQNIQDQTKQNSEILENDLYQMEYSSFPADEKGLYVVLELMIEQKVGHMIAVDEVVAEDTGDVKANHSDIPLDYLLEMLNMCEKEKYLQVRRLCDQVEDSIKREKEYQKQLSQYEESVVSIDEQLEVLQEERDAVYAQWKLDNKQ